MIEINGIKLYSNTEVSKMLCTSVNSLTKLRQEGLLRYTKIGRSIYSSEEAIKDYLNGIVQNGTKGHENNISESITSL